MHLKITILILEKILSMLSTTILFMVMTGQITALINSNKDISLELACIINIVQNIKFKTSSTCLLQCYSPLLFTSHKLQKPTYDPLPSTMYSIFGIKSLNKKPHFECCQHNCLLEEKKPEPQSSPSSSFCWLSCLCS